MNRRLALTSYLALWAILAAGGIFILTLAVSPLWAAIVCAFASFMLVNGTLAYRARVRQLTREGKAAPPYLQFLILPEGVGSFKKDAPRSTHVMVGVAAALAGVVFLSCGVTGAVIGEWSQILPPFVPAVICLALIGIGAAFLFLAWRLLAYRRPPNDGA